MLAGSLRIEIGKLLVACLNERQRLVIAGRFGLNGREYTIAELGRELGISHQRVQQIEQNALKKLRKHLAPELREYL